MSKYKDQIRTKRKASIRKKISGTAERPRLSVFRSSRHIYAQIIDDTQNRVLAKASTLEEELEKKTAGLKKKEKAVMIGQEIAKRCLQAGIQKVVFDRNGFIYHGRVSSLADGARQGGLEF